MAIYYIRDNNLYSKEEEDKTLVLKKNKKEIVELNEVGSLIWKLLKTKKTSDALTKKIAKEYDEEDLAVIRADVDEFLENCLKDSIIKETK